MSPTVDEIRRTAEARLRELEPLLTEAEQLQSLLAALDLREAPDPRQVHDFASAAQRPARKSASSRSARIRREQRGRDGRAPQGSNKRLILDVIGNHPGIAAPAIAELIGMKRTVVASTISRLKRTGELEPDGAGVRLPRAVRAA